MISSWSFPLCELVWPQLNHCLIKSLSNDCLLTLGKGCIWKGLCLSYPYISNVCSVGYSDWTFGGWVNQSTNQPTYWCFTVYLPSLDLGYSVLKNQIVAGFIIRNKRMALPQLLLSVVTLHVKIRLQWILFSTCDSYHWLAISLDLKITWDTSVHV